MPAISRSLLALVTVLLLSLAGVASARGGVYDVRQCDYAAGIGVHDFRWQEAGVPALAPHSGSGCAEFGLSARNGAPGYQQTYPSGGYGGWFAYAPPGTSIVAFSGAFGTLAGCCINGLATYGEATEQPNGSGARSYLFQGNLGNETWYSPSGIRGPVGRSWSASTSGFAAKRVGFHVRCGPGFSCPQGSAGDLRVRGRSFGFTIRDDVAPTMGAPGGSLLGGGWLSGTRTLAFSATDTGGGVTGVSATFDDGTVLGSPSSCAVQGVSYVRLQPCPLDRSGTWTVDTAGLRDGARAVTLRATDAGGAIADQARTVKTDNTAPAAPRGAWVAGGHGWRRSNAFDLRWTNPGGQHAPIGRVRWRVCPASGGECVSGERAGDGIAAVDSIAVPHPGEWDAYLWLEDAAGNADPASAAPPLGLRLDPDPPLLRFLAVDPADPTQVAVEATDVSGLAGGEIDLRRRGADRWRPLRTTRDGSRLLAAVDDSRLSGVYELRARAVDAAGNHALAAGPERRLPVRAATRLIVRRSAVRVRHLSTIAVRGSLESADGRPLPDRRVDARLVSRDRTVRLPALRTDAAGRLALALRAHRSAVVHLRFTGERSLRGSWARIAVRVPAPVTMLANRHIVRSGDRVRFHGRIRGGALPRRGKLVEIQAWFRGRWRTISAVRSGRTGHWRYGYAFQGTGRAASYSLRVRVPGEAGYPFAPGASRPVRVTVLAR